MPLSSLVFITGNENKVAEVSAILGNTVPLRSQSMHLTEIQGTIEDISKDKCRRAAAIVGGPVLTEDTCLCFNALKELPGPKWFLQDLGHDGLNKLLLAFEDKSAQAVCTFAFCKGPGHEPLLFEGRVTGQIVQARGPSTFGWDPIFEIQGETYAEMDKSRKNTLSHRALALAKLKDWLENQL